MEGPTQVLEFTFIGIDHVVTTEPITVSQSTYSMSSFTDLGQMTQELVLELEWGLYVLKSGCHHPKGGKDAGQTQNNKCSLQSNHALNSLKAEVMAY